MSKLIVNADDFGLHPAVNEGIIKGHCHGIITSTSLLAGAPAFDEAISLGRNCPNLGIGIHIALVGGISPVCDPSMVPSLLTEKGVFPDTYIELLKRIYTGKINYVELMMELEAQFKRILDTGLPVTHVDGHQHMHVLPTVLPIVLSLMVKYNLKAIRIPEENRFFLNGVYNPVRFVGKAGLSSVASRAFTICRDRGMASPRYFWGMINGGQLQEPRLVSILKEVASKNSTHEIMTHPGNNNAALGSLFDWKYHWEEELSALCSSQVEQYIRHNRIELINYGDLR